MNLKLYLNKILTFILNKMKFNKELKFKIIDNKIVEI